MIAQVEKGGKKDLFRVAAATTGQNAAYRLTHEHDPRVIFWGLCFTRWLWIFIHNLYLADMVLPIFMLRDSMHLQVVILVFPLT